MALPDCPEDFADFMGGIAFKKTIHEVHVEDRKMDSASNITIEQFALLRAFFPCRINAFDFSIYGTNVLNLKEARQYARELLNKCASYGHLLATLKNKRRVVELNEEDAEWPGMFVPFLQFLQNFCSPEGTNEDGQRRLRRSQRVNYGESTSAEGDTTATPSFSHQMAVSDKTYPEAKDEAVVNACCVLLLKALGQLMQAKSSNWTICHKAFKEDIAQVIIEVKPGIRSAILYTVMQQEAAEMVAWLKNVQSHQRLPDLQGHQLLVCQDRHEVFLAFARPSDEYRKYLDPERAIIVKKNNGFLGIQVCGPWDLTNAAAIDDVCEILLAIMLLAKGAE